MKIIKIVVFVLLVSSIGYSQGVEEFQNTFVVYGNATASAASNLADLNFSIFEKDPNFRTAYIKAREKASLLTKELENIGVPKNSISTSTLSTGSKESFSIFESNKLEYTVRLEINIHLESLSKFDEIMLTLAENGIRELSNVNFSFSKTDSLGYRAYSLALENAYEKFRIAKVITKNENMILLSIEEFSDQFGEVNNGAWDKKQNFIRGGRASEVAFVLDEYGITGKTVTISKKLKVTFLIKQ
ncbi:MAG: SIMPL domain-containing protein [Bacteroidetes bacterium]|nr:SIMPL domain-containing protein [Bacteroidota bacterium]